MYVCIYVCTYVYIVVDTSALVCERVRIYIQTRTHMPFYNNLKQHILTTNFNEYNTYIHTCCIFT